jgi:hypothetical protein
VLTETESSNRAERNHLGRTDEKKKKISFTNFFKIYFDNRFSGFPTRKPVCTVRTVRSPLSTHELEILQPDQKNLVIARVKKICVSVVYSKIFVFCLKKKIYDCRKQQNTCDDAIFSLSLFLFSIMRFVFLGSSIRPCFIFGFVVSCPNLSATTFLMLQPWPMAWQWQDRRNKKI